MICLTYYAFNMQRVRSNYNVNSFHMESFLSIMRSLWRRQRNRVSLSSMQFGLISSLDCGSKYSVFVTSATLLFNWILNSAFFNSVVNFQNIPKIDTKTLIQNDPPDPYDMGHESWSIIHDGPFLQEISNRYYFVNIPFRSTWTGIRQFA